MSLVSSVELVLAGPLYEVGGSQVILRVMIKSFFIFR